MKKVEYWEAEDGERFATEAACIEYENRFDELLGKVKFFDANYELMTGDFVSNADECYAMYISTNEAAEKLHEVFENESIESPFNRGYYRKPKSGHYFYKSKWYCLEEEWERLKTIEEKLNKAKGLI